MKEIIDDIKKTYKFNHDGKVINKGVYQDCCLASVYFGTILSDGADCIDISKPYSDVIESLIEANDEELKFFNPPDGKIYFWFSDHDSYCLGDWIDKKQFDALIKEHALDLQEYEEEDAGE